MNLNLKNLVKNLMIFSFCNGATWSADPQVVSKELYNDLLKTPQNQLENQFK